jgi:multiple sugar transport system substrate-binding protein
MTPMKWMSGVLLLLVLTIVYLVVYAYVVRPPEPGVTEIYYADRITEAHRILIDKYNMLNAGKVRVVPTDFSNLDFSTNERKEILARSLRGEGDGIDLMAVDIIWVQRFAKWCEPLGQYFAQEELQNIIPEALYSCYSDSQLVAVPLDLVQSVLYYREDLLKAAPGGEQIIQQLQKGMTWAEFVGLKGRIPRKGPFYVFPAAEYEGLICNYTENLLSLDDDYFKTIGFNFNTPQARVSLQLMVDLVYKYGASPGVVTKFTEVPSYEYFVKNDGLFIRGWISYDKDFKTTPFDERKEQHLRKAPLPYMAGGRPASVFGGWNLMISRFSKKKAAVVDFVKFLLREDSQEAFYTIGGYYPVVKGFYTNPANLQKYPEIPRLKELMRTGVHRPRARGYTNYSKIMSHYLGMALEKRISVEEAMESTTRAIQSENTVAESK